MQRNIAFISANMKKTIRFELMAVSAFCLFISLIIFALCNNIFLNNSKIAKIDYKGDMDKLVSYSIDLVNSMIKQKISIKDKLKIQLLIDNVSKHNVDTVLVVDLDGKVLYKSANTPETQVDLNNIIKNAMENRNITTAILNNNDKQNASAKEFTSFYPINFKDGRAYIIVRGIPEGSIIYEYNGDSFLALLIAIIAFIILFLIITNKKMNYFQEITEGLLEISKGNLDYRVSYRGRDELAMLASNINHMTEKLNHKIEKERMIEKSKNELITNVSHDLRTPLTSIMGYLGLLIDKRYENEEQMKDYLGIAYSKSQKLKVLMESLFEYTKITSEKVKLNLSKIALNELIDQLIEELVPLCEENRVVIKKQMDNVKIMVIVDPDKIIRVFENLIMNAIKYSYPHSDIIVALFKEENNVIVSISNKGDTIPENEIKKVFDRFYRVEKSRPSNMGGSGLGLAIAKEIVELHGGDIWAESHGNTIRFCVKLNISL